MNQQLAGFAWARNAVTVPIGTIGTIGIPSAYKAEVLIGAPSIFPQRC
jgi:hypothetical protein